MPVLSWIGKEAIVNHDKEVPFRLLKKIKSLSVGESENLIIEGDNLEGLKALLPYYQNKIKCIYIDPPYNTGNENWVYNDNVNAPKIKQWLGKTVGSDVDDLTRHDKWLCMMYPRLKLLRELLSDDGFIFVSIDDNEVHNLRLIMDEIFHQENFISEILPVVNPGGRDYNQIAITHEYVLVYSKSDLSELNEIPKDVVFSFKDSKGGYEIRELRNRNPKFHSGNRPNLFYPIYINTNLKDENGFCAISLTKTKSYNIEVKPYNSQGKESVWRWGTKKVQENLVPDNVNASQIIAKQRHDGGWNIYEKSRKSTTKVKSIWNETEMRTENGTRLIRKIFGFTVFDHPKSLDLIKRILQIATADNDIVLDSFAGSGTTGHAVLEINKEDGGNRKFILIEMENKICREITSQRIKKVCEGYSHENIKVPGLGGGFQYCVLSKPLFDKDGKIDEECKFEDLASYIYFTETKTILDKNKISKNFIGEHSETKYYLIFHGIGKNTLTLSFLKGLDKESRKVIYADNCTISEDELEHRNIVFKQIPYEVRVF